jgi:hypothetical protein
VLQDRQRFDNVFAAAPSEAGIADLGKHMLKRVQGETADSGQISVPVLMPAALAVMGDAPLSSRP